MKYPKKILLYISLFGMNFNNFKENGITIYLYNFLLLYINNRNIICYINKIL